jgi:hypothetical protein
MAAVKDSHLSVELDHSGGSCSSTFTRDLTKRYSRVGRLQSVITVGVRAVEDVHDELE